MSEDRHRQVTRKCPYLRASFCASGGAACRRVGETMPLYRWWYVMGPPARQRCSALQLDRLKRIRTAVNIIRPFGSLAPPTMMRGSGAHP